MTSLDRTFTAPLVKSPAGVRDRIGEQAGDSVTVVLTERIAR